MSSRRAWELHLWISATGACAWTFVISIRSEAAPSHSPIFPHNFPTAMGSVVDLGAQWKLWVEFLASLMSIVGLSTLFDTLFANSYLQESAKLLILGSIIETGRRLCQWVIERFKFRRLRLSRGSRVATNLLSRVFFVGTFWWGRSCIRVACSILSMTLP